MYAAVVMKGTKVHNPRAILSLLICAAAAVMYAGYSTLLCCVCHNS